MRQADTFSSYHPAINFLFFALVLIFTMFFMHPACLVLSLGCALTYGLRLTGRKTLRFILVSLLPLMLLAALINPAFNHQGATLLAYLPSGNPLTLESIAYGLGAATMLAAVILWFRCYSVVMTSDKFVYLFGRIIPSLSLVLSMALRFVPKFHAQAKEVARAQRCLGRDLSTGRLFSRARTGVTILSILITWSLESAIETADSMRSRGYGLPGRSAFSIYHFDGRDRAALGWLLLAGGYLLAGWRRGALSWRYFPTLKGGTVGIYPVSVLLAYLALCLTPLILNRREARKWTHSPSKT